MAENWVRYHIFKIEICNLQLHIRLDLDGFVSITSLKSGDAYQNINPIHVCNLNVHSMGDPFLEVEKSQYNKHYHSLLCTF